MLPEGWDSYRFFALGPRHLEAVLTKTAQILVEGAYSGVLHPHKHYIELKRDFSNLSEVLNRIHQPEFLQSMVDRAYSDIVLSGEYTYHRFAQQIAEVIAAHTNLPQIHPIDDNA